MTRLLFPELSYKITGLCFKVHKKLGRFCRERQYADALESLLKKDNMNHKREYEIANLKPNGLEGNRVDFLIEDKIIVDLKTKKFITKEDYNQIQRYLQSSGLELGMIINFRSTYLKPKRILNTKIYSDNSDANSDNSDRFIDKNMKIEEVIKKYPETIEVFAKHGFHCLGCAAASFESIEDEAKAHGITSEEIVEELNKTIHDK